MTHTPGPWVVETNEDGDLIVTMGTAHDVFFGNMEDTCEQCHANAWLTAKAPTMYAALKRILDHGFSAQAEEQARAAIQID